MDQFYTFNHVIDKQRSLWDNLETLCFILFPSSFPVLQEHRLRFWFITDIFSFRFSHITLIGILEYWLRSRRFYNLLYARILTTPLFMCAQDQKFKNKRAARRRYCFCKTGRLSKGKKTLPHHYCLWSKHVNHFSCFPRDWVLRHWIYCFCE